MFKISIITVLYNAAATIEQTILSVIFLIIHRGAFLLRFHSV